MDEGFFWQGPKYRHAHIPSHVPGHAIFWSIFMPPCCRYGLASWGGTDLFLKPGSRVENGMFWPKNSLGDQTPEMPNVLSPSTFARDGREKRRAGDTKKAPVPLPGMAGRRGVPESGTGTAGSENQRCRADRQRANQLRLGYPLLAVGYPVCWKPWVAVDSRASPVVVGRCPPVTPHNDTHTGQTRKPMHSAVHGTPCAVLKAPVDLIPDQCRPNLCPKIRG